MSYDSHRRAMFAKGLKAARQRAGVSAQEASAQLAARGLECSLGTLLAWERGVGTTTREPSASDLAVIAAIYACPVDFFFQEFKRPEADVESVGVQSDGG